MHPEAATMPAPLLLHIYPGFPVGGAQVRFAAIANRYPGRWRHAVVAMDGNLACRERLSPAVDVSFPEIGIRKGDTLGNLRRFRAVLQAMQPHALITSNWGSIEWAMANAWPLVRHVHIEDGFGPEEQATQIPRRVWTRRLVLRRSQVVVPSRVLWGIATGVWRLNPKRLRYIPNGINTARFAETCQTAGPAREPVVGTVAALRAEKNIARLLRAFRMVATAVPGQLVIVGDGPERAALQALTAELGLADRVIFTGHDAQPQDRYPNFDVFALSSDTEQMPLSVLEAMATGLPVAATDVGDIGTMLAPENAALLASRDDAALAGAIKALLLQPALRRELGAANRAKALRDYDEERMFAAYATIFDGEPELTR
jgi:glycosyltransferase involved in cell wall biosynthesis